MVNDCIEGFLLSTSTEDLHKLPQVFTSVGGAGTTNQRSCYAAFPETRSVPSLSVKRTAVFSCLVRKQAFLFIDPPSTILSDAGSEISQTKTSANPIQTVDWKRHYLPLINHKDLENSEKCRAIVCHCNMPATRARPQLPILLSPPLPPTFPCPHSSPRLRAHTSPPPRTSLPARPCTVPLSHRPCYHPLALSCCTS